MSPIKFPAVFINGGLYHLLPDTVTLSVSDNLRMRDHEFQLPTHSRGLLFYIGTYL